MSQLGQKAKCSLRADVFCSAPDTGHRSIGSAGPFGAARNGHGDAFETTRQALELRVDEREKC